MNFLSRLIYPSLGALVLGSYLYTVKRGIEPFEVSSDRRQAPAGARTARSSSHRRHPRGSTLIWFSGFGGK